MQHVYDERCFIGVCGRALLPPQQPCEEVVRPSSHSQICTACEKNGLSLGVEENILRYGQFELFRSAFPGYKNVIGDVRDTGLGERANVTTKKDGEGEQQKCCALSRSQSLCCGTRSLVSANPGDLVIDPFARTFLTTAACVRMVRYLVLLCARRIWSGFLRQQKLVVKCFECFSRCWIAR